jgi:hypothetical protein
MPSLIQALHFFGFVMAVPRSSSGSRLSFMISVRSSIVYLGPVFERINRSFGVYPSSRVGGDRLAIILLNGCCCSSCFSCKGVVSRGIRSLVFHCFSCSIPLRWALGSGRATSLVSYMASSVDASSLLPCSAFLFFLVGGGFWVCSKFTVGGMPPSGGAVFVSLEPVLFFCLFFCCFFCHVCPALLLFASLNSLLNVQMERSHSYFPMGSLYPVNAGRSGQMTLFLGIP